jgi:hypothetical protein
MIQRDFIGQEFQRNFAIKLRVLGKIHLSHATLAELGEDVVMGDCRSYHCVVLQTNLLRILSQRPRLSS